MARGQGRRWTGAAGTLAALCLVGACATTGAPASEPAAPRSSAATQHARPAAHVKARHPHAAAHPRRRTALGALALLAVKGRAPMTGYSREEFGQAWLDADRNGCDTRNDVLRRDLTDVVLDPATHGCVALSGRLADPYTGTTIPFRRGYGDDVDVDHVVALGDAWATGAARWNIRRRAALANDPLNLLAVDAHENRQKGDADAASWLPAAHGFRCAYVARQVAVKRKYHLWTTPAEHDAIARVLAGCPGRRLPRDTTHAPTTVDQHLQEPSAPPSPTAHATGAPRSLVGVSYANCTAARAAGVTPLHRGDPGYSPHLDRDGDGVACED